MTNINRFAAACLAIVLVFGAWSMYHPADRFTWVLEVTPLLIGLPVLALTYRRFRFTPLTYAVMTAHAVLLLVGGHYTYEHVPIGNWARDVLGFSRNHFDRVGHFFQGLTPAMVAWEVLPRTSPLKPGKWMAFLTISACMAVSAWYELLEFAAAFLTGDRADAFLAFQGDPWDTQRDMLTCFAGAVCALVFFSRWQGRAMARATEARPPAAG